MQSIEHGILPQLREISVSIQGIRRAHDAALVQDLCALLRMRREKTLKLFFRHAPRIHVLTRHDRVDRQERLALIFECGCDWSLIQTVERQQILRSSRRSHSLVECDQIAIGTQRLVMSLIPS